MVEVGVQGQGREWGRSETEKRISFARPVAAFYIYVEMAATQISAFISDETKASMERYVDAHGVKKNHLVEEALLHHLQALQELPADVIIPPRIVLTNESFDQVAKLVKRPRSPTEAMRDLMAGKRRG